MEPKTIHYYENCYGMVKMPNEVVEVSTSLNQHHGLPTTDKRTLGYKYLNKNVFPVLDKELEENWFKRK